MPNCPNCLEEIKAGAKKCPHCQSSLDASAAPDGDTVYILDKGLVRFGKFAVAILGAFLIVGVYVYGLDIKDAIKKTSEAEIEVKRGLLSVEQQKSALESKIAEINKAIERIGELEKEVVRHRDETKKSADEVKGLMSDIRNEKTTAVQLVLELRQRTLSPAEEKAANSKREEHGIGTDRGSLWNVGSTLHFRFLDGQQKSRDLVRAAISEWAKYVNLTLEETTSEKAELRISFKEEGSWSYIGTQALGIPQNKPTINYGTLEQITDKDDARMVALHEFGHALGLQHEFQNPSAGNIFNVAATYEYYSRLGFSKAATDTSVLDKAETDFPGQRPYDPMSVMNNTMPANLFTTPDKQTRPGAHLSDSDKRYVASLYPKG